ncbi:tyrosine-type recombinase/integrase [Mucilaginibacter sp. SP1R1]|uniref:tyrosine-type recombinase/integrase n=1 Tax=Mucilaginibacter sp. SP1R1 TaxID=2723091 RepID=UPI00160BE315|nr:site-specific integrase [Mucilaginibacter sp. SP1R1]MBB6152768.1 site-specific recombinase XerD [Mucilaginibacter sp. SP1R1]
MKKNKGILIKSYDKYDFILLKDKSGRGKNLLYYYFFNPQTGKDERVRISKGLIGNLTDRELMNNAHDLADAIIGLLKKQSYNPITGTFSDTPIITPSTSIIDCTANWINYRQKEFGNDSIGETRLESSKNIINHFVKWLLKENFQYRKPGTFNELDLADFLNSKTKEHGWNKETFNSYRDDIKSFFIYLIKLKVIEDNPVSGVPRKNTKNDTTIFKIYEEDELSNVLKLLNESKEYLNLLVAAKMLYKYSIRLEEQLKLQIENYNPQKRLLVVPPQKTKNGDEAIFQIDEEMHLLLMRLIREYPSKCYIYGNRSKPAPDRLAYGFFGQKWRKFRDKHNISKELKLYALKHSSAHYSLEEGEEEVKLSKRMRHSKLSTTRRYSENGIAKKAILPTANTKF